MSIKDIQVFHTNEIKLHGEVRRVEEVCDKWKTKEGKDMETQYMILKIDDDNEDRIELIDKDMSHKDLYVKGRVGTFTLRLDIQKEFGNKYTTQINIIDFKEDGKG